jgi:hypothetical protein
MIDHPIFLRVNGIRVLRTAAIHKKIGIDEIIFRDEFIKIICDFFSVSQLLS